MAEFSITLSSIKNSKTVEIKGLGMLTARKLGSGEELELSAKMRRTGKIIDELSKTDFSKLDTSKPEHLKIVQRMAKKFDSLTNELDAIKIFEFNTYKSLLSDDKDGAVVDVIMSTLTDEERAKLFKMIFGEVDQINSPEATVDAEGSKDV